MRTPSLSALLAALLPGLLLPPASQAAVQFLVDDLGTLGGNSARARAINDSGVVAGSTSTVLIGAPLQHPFVWRSTALGGVASDPFHGVPGEVRAIDAAGNVYGWAQFPGQSKGEAVYTGTLPGLFRVFPAGTPSLATAGRDGRVIGQCQNAAACGWRGFVHEALGNTTLLGAPGDTVLPLAMNSSGTIVGTWAVWYAISGTDAFQTAGQAKTLLEPVGGDLRSSAQAINDDGVAVGWTAGFVQPPVATRFAAGSVQYLGTLGGPSSEARGINQAGQIVGTADNAAGQARGFITTGATLWDLNALTLGRGIAIASADAINRDGQIAATSNTGHALRLTPTGTLQWRPGAGSGRFADGSQWDSQIGFSPNPLLPASIAPSVITDVVADADATLPQLTVGQARSGGAPVTLWLQSGSTVLATSGTLLWPNATLDSRDHGRLAGGLDNHGTVQLEVMSTLTIDAPFINRGRVQGRTQLINGQPAGANILRGQLVNDVAGVVMVTDQQTVTLDGALHTNDGLLQVQAGASQWAALRSSGRVDNHAGGQIVLSNGTLDSAGGLVNDGQVQCSGPQATLSGPLTNRFGGRIVAHSGCTLVLDGPVANDGQITAEPGAKLIFKVLPITGSGSVIQ